MKHEINRIPEIMNPVTPRPDLQREGPKKPRMRLTNPKKVDRIRSERHRNTRGASE